MTLYNLHFIILLLKTKIIVSLLNKKDVNLPPNSIDISITSPVVMAALPDISLLVHFLKKSRGNSREFSKSRSVFELRRFLQGTVVTIFGRIARL